jgi:hypothetical protein
MPSIPQSLLWISLVVLWLFVLVPMLISKRDAVRRTSDVALATRVLNGGANSRLIKRAGPAAGHRSDPHWRADDSAADEDADHGKYDDEDGEAETEDMPIARPVVMKVAPVEETAPDYLDVDVIEDSGALPVGASAAEETPAEDVAVDETEDEADEDETEPQAVERADDTDVTDDEYEYIEDSSGLEPEADADEYADGRAAASPAARAAARRHRFDAKTAAAVSARKYAFRRKVLMAMAVVLVGSATAAFEVSSSAWWLCGPATVVTMFYLAYLRRQTKIEEQVRRRRAKRMARARVGVENTRDHDYDVVPSRLRRPGAVVLEIDDEDPIFEHLDNAVPIRAFGWPRDLPRAVGE